MADNQNIRQTNDFRFGNGEDYLLVYAKNVKKDINRTIDSLGFIDHDLPDDLNDLDIDGQIDIVNKELLSIDEKLDGLKEKYKDLFSAEIPESDLERVEDLSEKYQNTKITSKNKQVENPSNKDKKNKDNKKAPLNEENYLLVYPKIVGKDVSRSINTLGFIDKEVPDELLASEIDQEYQKTTDELNEINKEIDQINSQYKDVLENLSYSLDYAKKSEDLKTKMAKGEDYFYLSGWVPESELSKFESLERDYKNTTLTTKDDKSVNEQPPTRLKNKSVFRPFEYLVNMYGAPSYDEVDPTAFFAITYMLLYGLMFGDLGQGLVFLALGFWLSKKNKTYGALLKRVGISASVFGLMYGSFFGREDLIPALLIKPFDNVMTVLVASVAFGVSLMVISYIIGIYNKVKKQDNIEEGIFGKEGLAGLMMMISFIIIILNLVEKSPIPMPVGIIVLVMSIIMMIFKQPIARKLKGSKRLYDTGKGDYYIESSFSIIEALLSVFSNLVSFTRVGAFAINHVGLYMAFEVMASIAGGGFWGTIILILGNILIIGLEGMIVFIQGLRLEFYEMFSKYYEGNGRLFRPINSNEE